MLQFVFLGRRRRRRQKSGTVSCVQRKWVKPLCLHNFTVRYVFFFFFYVLDLTTFTIFRIVPSGNVTLLCATRRNSIILLSCTRRIIIISGCFQPFHCVLVRKFAHTTRETSRVSGTRAEYYCVYNGTALENISAKEWWPSTLVNGHGRNPRSS